VITIIVVRKGERKAIKVKLGTRPNKINQTSQQETPQPQTPQLPPSTP
ncbi:MAG: hypothetical protein JHC87_07735, partial [Thermoleophilaceae bacterium]|nr:hypothetical protein [Thermoleophilaceae bacterium]